MSPGSAAAQPNVIIHAGCPLTENNEKDYSLFAFETKY
jgi:hypothetical protein